MTNQMIRSIVVADAPIQFPRTDAGNGEHFAHLFGDRVRFDHSRGRWLLWTQGGHWWIPDATDQVRVIAKDAARIRYRDATAIEDVDDRGKEAKWAIASEGRARIEATLVQAASESPIADNGAGWDADPWLLAVANGVIDLRTGLLRPGRPEDKITQHSPTRFDPDATCPRWERFLVEVTAGNDELVAFLQRAVGYSLSGDTREQCVFLCYGKGANGKGTVFRTLLGLTGDYGHNMPFSTLELDARASIPSDVADLAGKRFVTASETNEAARLNEARLKALTGQDPMTARQLHQRFFTFVPVAKFWLASNHKPRVGDDSYGFWRRIRLIPFTRKFGPDGLPIDRALDETLAAEAPGILAWAVRGCLIWQCDGLGVPQIVSDATDEYRRESDPLGEFLDTCCVQADGLLSAAGELYAAYSSWATRAGLSERERLTSTRFGRRMVERFTRTKGRQAFAYAGIGLLAEIERGGLGQLNPPQTMFSLEKKPSREKLPESHHNPPHPPQTETEQSRANGHMENLALLDESGALSNGHAVRCAGCGQTATGSLGPLREVGAYQLHDNCRVSLLPEKEFA